MAFQRLSKDEARAALAVLVEEYRAQATTIDAAGAQYSEAQLRLDFLDKFLRIFGWDVNNDDGKPQGLRDVVVERTLTEEGASGRPDYRLRVDGRDRIPLEAKKPAVQLSTSAASATQARSYGFTLQRPAAILSNFAETVIYDTTLPPEDGDGPDVAVLPGCRFGWGEYVERFDELWEHLSYEVVASEKFYEVYEYTEPPRGQSAFDQTFLAHFRDWRLRLAQMIADENPTLEAADVGRRTQRLLNALLFLRVCEDRNIGKYKDLLAAANDAKLVEEFEAADKVFNAGLFSVLQNTAVSTKTLKSVVSAMYWPQSKFAYALLDADTLSAVYEQYLAERVVFDPIRRVLLQAKPELTHSGGVVPTPLDVVNYLLDDALAAVAPAGTLSADLSLLDPALGSGIFPVEGLKRLILMAEAAGETVDLARRAELALRHIYGVDIDGEAVEVAKLSLLLVVLGEDFVDVRTQRSVLPDLSKNLQVGNSLVGTDFDKLMPVDAAIPEIRAEVAPFDWKTAFPAVLAAGGFSIVIGNPPYVRIQVLKDHLRKQLDYFQDPRAKYKSTQGSFDQYMLFMERALALVAADGVVALVVKNSLVTSPSAAPLREALAARLRKLVHFGSQQIFPGRSTYACLVIASGSDRTADVDLLLVHDVETWLDDAAGVESITVDRAELDGAPWLMASAGAAAVYAKMDAVAVARLGDPGWVQVFVGVQTSADDVFYVRVVEDDGVSALIKIKDDTGRVWKIERGLIKKVIRDRPLAPYGGEPESDYVAIFPYEVAAPAPGRVRGRATLYSRGDLEARFPRALNYLEAHESRLRKRSISPDPGEAFWAYGRSQSLVKMDETKIINRTLSVSPQYVPDESGLVIPGGGDGGPYTLLRPEPGCPLTPEAVIALLSHPIVDAYIAARSKEYRGAYVVHRKATLEPVPVPPLSTADITELTQKVRELQQAEVRLRTEADEKIIAALTGRRTVLIEAVNEIILGAFGLGPDDVVAVTG